MTTELTIYKTEPSELIQAMLPPPPITEEEIATAVANAKTVVVDNGPSLRMANDLIKSLAAAVKSLDKWIAEPKDFANKIHKGIVAAHKDLCAPLVAEMKRLEDEKKVYERKVEEANAAAAAAIRAGEVEEWMVDMTPLPTTDGMYKRKASTPTVEIKDAKAFLAYCLNDNLDLVEITPSAKLKAMASSMGLDILSMVPGLNVYYKESIVKR